MKKFAIAVLLACGLAQAQTTYDSTTKVDTNNTSTSTSTVNSTNTNTVTSTNTNTNHNISSGSVTYTNNNNNVNSGTMTYNNNNVSSGNMTYNNNNVSNSTNTNHNINSGTQTFNNNSTSANTNVNQNIQSGELTNRNLNTSDITQRVIQPPPTAVAPTMMSGGNNDLCTTGTSGSVQTQIFGVSSGGTVRDENCERLKLSKTLFDMGMKVAAVSVMCQDRRVWDAMMSAGTPCPYEGKIGAEARALWEDNPEQIPQPVKAQQDDTYKKIISGSLLGIAAYKLFGY